MKIGFAVRVDRDTKTMETFPACPECRDEVQLFKKTPTTVQFICKTHGDIGTMPFEEFQQALQRAQARIAAQEGFGEPVRTTLHFISSDPDTMN